MLIMKTVGALLTDTFLINQAITSGKRIMEGAQAC